MPPRPNARVLRDIKARQGVANNEISRRAYLYVARNHTLPAHVRYQAQLQLNAFDRYARPTTVKNRCTASGRGRGVLGEFGLCRVSGRTCFPFPFSFRDVHCADWVMTCGMGSTVPISFEGSRGRVARRLQGLLVEVPTITVSRVLADLRDDDFGLLRGLACRMLDGLGWTRGQCEGCRIWVVFAI